MVSYYYFLSFFVQVWQWDLSLIIQGIFVFVLVYDDLLLVSVIVFDFGDSVLRVIEKGYFFLFFEFEKEVKIIVELFNKYGVKDNVLVFCEEVDELGLKYNLEQNFIYFYIVGYSFVNVKQLKFFGIVCVNNLLEKEEDGILYFGEIYVLKIKVDLIIFSSCESGFGKFD